MGSLRGQLSVCMCVWWGRGCTFWGFRGVTQVNRCWAFEHHCWSLQAQTVSDVTEAIVSSGFSEWLDFLISLNDRAIFENNFGLNQIFCSIFLVLFSIFCDFNKLSVLSVILIKSVRFFNKKLIYTMISLWLKWK